MEKVDSIWKTMGGLEIMTLQTCIGWFTTLIPIILKVDNPKDYPTLIKTIKESTRREQDDHPPIYICFQLLGSIII